MLDRILRFVFESKAFKEAVYREATKLSTAEVVVRKALPASQRVAIVKGAIASGATNRELDRVISDALEGK